MGTAALQMGRQVSGCFIFSLACVCCFPMLLGFRLAAHMLSGTQLASHLCMPCVLALPFLFARPLYSSLLDEWIINAPNQAADPPLPRYNATKQASVARFPMEASAESLTTPTANRGIATRTVICHAEFLQTSMN